MSGRAVVSNMVGVAVMYSAVVVGSDMTKSLAIRRVCSELLVYPQGRVIIGGGCQIHAAASGPLLGSE